MQVKKINSSKLEWEVFHNTDGSVTYCADGDGFVTLDQHEDDNGELYWFMSEQGSPVADINCMNENLSLADALEIAQNYLAATYNRIFQEQRTDK
jgi:hypothetical protein